MPSAKGLEKLKDVLWKVFDGKEFHRNEDETGQLSFFSTEDEKELRAKEYATEAKRMLLKKYSGAKVSYPTIEMYLIENTMLREGQIIKYVIKPMLDEGILTKNGETRTSSNFGRMHYNKQVSMYKEYRQFYNQCSEEVISFCDERNIDYHIKKGTITE